MAQVTTGITGFTGGAGSLKSISVSASTHTVIQELKKVHMEAAFSRLARLYAYLSEDSESLSFLTSLGGVWASAALELSRASEIGCFYSTSKIYDEDGQLTGKVKIHRDQFNIKQIVECISAGKDPYGNISLSTVRSLCELWDDPAVYEMAKASAVGLAIHTEQIEYQRRGRYAYLHLEAIPSVDEVQFILEHDTIEYATQYWGVLACIMGVYNPTIISSWDSTIMMPAVLKASRLIARGGFDLTQGVAMSSLNSLLIGINSSWVIEIRTDNIDEGAVETRFGGFIRTVYVLTPPPSYNIDNGNSSAELRPPSIHYFRYRGSPDTNTLAAYEGDWDLSRGWARSGAGSLGEYLISSGFGDLLLKE